MDKPVCALIEGSKCSASANHLRVIDAFDDPLARMRLAAVEDAPISQ
jgi:hypothetical protein